MKKTTMLAAASICALGLVSAKANLIVNGDFEAGNTGFTSDYEYTAVAGGLSTGGEGGAGGGKYAVGTNPNFYHSSFVVAGDHTTGSGNMMIVNGSPTAGKNVWQESIGPLVAGQQYTFTAWVMNVYGSNPASLSFNIGGNALGSFSAAGSGTWSQFTSTFTAVGGSASSVIDLNVLLDGNDFALDDLNLVAVPEPTTMLAGALLLLPFGISTARVLRRKASL